MFPISKTITRAQDRPPRADFFDKRLYNLFISGVFLQIPLGAILQSCSPLWLSICLRILFLGAWGSICAQFLIKHRRMHDWRWPGVTLGQVRASIVTFLGGGVISFVIVPAILLLLLRRRSKHFPSWNLDIQNWQSHVNPELFTNPVVLGISIVVFCGFLVNILQKLHFIYDSRRAFLQDCRSKMTGTTLTLEDYLTDDLLDVIASQLLWQIDRFFYKRYVVIRKTSDSIRVEYFTSSSKELKTYPFFWFFGIFLAFSVLIIIHAAIMLIAPLTQGKFTVDLIPSTSVIFYEGILVLIFGYASINTLTQKIIEFTPAKLTITTQLFRHTIKTKTIDKTHLQPLKLRSKKVLAFDSAGKSVILAAHLSTEAMERLVDIYEQYRTASFAQTYGVTEPCRLPAY
jgi:hypothetical protein